MDANLQSLIYSRLANQERKADNPADVLDAITKKHSLFELGPAELVGIDEKFQAALSCDQPGAFQALFASEELALKASGQLSLKKASLLQSRKRDMDKANADIFRLQKETRLDSAAFKDLEELCRNLQAVSVEKQDSNTKLLRAEAERTAEIDRECQASLSGVTAKIDAEEADIDLKAAENVDLLSKMEQFKAHLDLRREKLRNEKKTQELMVKLEAAQSAQRNFHQEQEQLQRDSCKAKIVHSKETILQLEQQLAMYTQKFGEFEDTLSRSAEVLQQLDERERSMAEVVAKLRADSVEWGQRAAQAQANLITALGQQRSSEEQVKGLQADLIKAEKHCRKLQARRKEVLAVQSRESKNAGTSGGSGGRGAIPFPMKAMHRGAEMYEMEGGQGGASHIDGASSMPSIPAHPAQTHVHSAPSSSSHASPSSSSSSSPARKLTATTAAASEGSEGPGEAGEAGEEDPIHLTEGGTS
jgi:hypothetical protein